MAKTHMYPGLPRDDMAALFSLSRRVRALAEALSTQMEKIRSQDGKSDMI